VSFDEPGAGRLGIPKLKPTCCEEPQLTSLTRATMISGSPATGLEVIAAADLIELPVWTSWLHSESPM
jgi:hypothetical protein